MTATAPLSLATTSRPIKMLHLCTRYARGGSEQRVRDIIDSCEFAEHTLIVGRDSLVDRARSDIGNAEVRCEDALVREIDARSDLVALSRFRDLIRTENYDVLVTHQSKAGALGRMACPTVGRPVVMHSLSMALTGRGYGTTESATYSSIERLLSRRTDAYVVVGRDLSRRYRRLGIPEYKLNIVRSAARLPEPGDHAASRAKVAERYGLPIDRPWILYLGALESRKCVLNLPILLQQVAQQIPTPRPFLIVAGEGSSRPELESLLARTGQSSDAALLGHVDDPADLLRGADLLVLTSRAEGLPQVLVQAAAVGTPFVSTDIDGARELLEMGAVGMTAEVEDVFGLVRGAVKLLRADHRPNHRIINLSEWRRDRVMQAYANLMSSLLSGAQSRAHA